MNIEEIRKGAPKDATHYYINYRNFNIYYFKKVNKNLFMWNSVKEWFSESSHSVAIKPL